MTESYKKPILNNKKFVFPEFLFVITLTAIILLAYFIFETKDVGRIVTQMLNFSSERVKIPAGWKTNICKYDGYEISYPPEIIAHKIFPWLEGCLDVYGYSSIEDPIKTYRTDKRQTDGIYFRSLNEKNVLINGKQAKYMQVEEISTKNQYLLYEIPRGKRYYYVRLELDYKSPTEELDFYKDTDWQKMTDAYYDAVSATSSVSPAQRDMVKIFHQMAQTFVFR